MSVYDQVVKAALHGPEIKELKVHGHEFNVKPVKRSWQGGTLFVSGQISHCLRWRKDDQVYYTFSVQDGRVSNIQKTTREGHTLETVFEWSHRLGSAVIGIFIPGLGTVLEAATPVLSEAVHAADDAAIGNWQEACTSMIAVIAVAIAEQVRAARGVSPQPAQMSGTEEQPAAH